MPNPQLFYGPMLIGVFFNILLYGVLVVQIYNYFISFKRSDKLWIRCLVLYMLFVETVNTGCMMQMMYEPLILHMGGPFKPPLLLPSNSVMTVVISTPVQLFLAWRIRALSNSFIIPGAIFILSLASFGGGIATTALVVLTPDFAKFQAKITPSVFTWLITSAAADVLITTSLVVSLYRKRTGMPLMDNLINKMIVFTVQTGLITAVLAIADIICVTALPNTGFNFIPAFILCKSYSNTLVASLNARTDPSWPHHPDDLVYSNKHGEISTAFQFQSQFLTRTSSAQTGGEQPSTRGA